MKLINISLESISHLKGNSFFDLTCDGCSCTIHRKVKEIRRCIKNGKQLSFCSNTCQGKTLKVNKTKECPICNTHFEYNFPAQIFCSIKCANTGRTHTDETKQKISNSVLKLPRIIKPSRRLYKHPEVVGKFEKIIICKCKNCSFVGSYRNQTGYCNNCKHCYSENGRAKFAFTFNVYDFPDLFDIDLIEQHGWRKTKGENININGVSRDHRVSVHEAIINDYDAYYIKHPMNCKVMLHSDNQSKGTQSSISYEELVRIVDLYDWSRQDSNL